MGFQGCPIPFLSSIIFRCQCCVLRLKRRIALQLTNLHLNFVIVCFNLFGKVLTKFLPQQREIKSFWRALCNQLNEQFLEVQKCVMGFCKCQGLHQSDAVSVGDCEHSTRCFPQLVRTLPKQNYEKVIRRANLEGKTVHVETLLDLRHLKNSDPKVQRQIGIER